MEPSSARGLPNFAKGCVSQIPASTDRAGAGGRSPAATVGREAECDLFRSLRSFVPLTESGSMRRSVLPKCRPDQHARPAPFDDPSRDCYDPSAGWSSLVARWAHNPKVGGSNPPPATNELIENKQVKKGAGDRLPCFFLQLCSNYAGLTESVQAQARVCFPQLQRP